MVDEVYKILTFTECLIVSACLFESVLRITRMRFYTLEGRSPIFFTRPHTIINHGLRALV